MTHRASAVSVGAMVLCLTQAALAAPPWTQDGNCAMCHTSSAAGAITVLNPDALANLNGYSNVKVIKVDPGQTKRLSAAVSGLAEGSRYGVMLKGFVDPGVQAQGTLQYGPDCGWSEWWYTFFTDPPRTDNPSTYYVAPSGKTAFDYDIQIPANCPNDYYDLTFAVAGVPKDGTDLFYGEEHFLLQVGSGTPTAPAIALSKTALAATAAVGATPPDDSFTVANSGIGTLNYTITSSASWLTVSPASGASTGPANTHAVRYNTASLAAGTYTATITVTDAGATNSPQTVAVTLTIGGSGGDPAAGQTLYNQRCNGCHSSPAALAPFAYRITTNMSSITPSHNGITLTTQQVADLQAYLATFTNTSPSITLNKTTLAPVATVGTNPPTDTFTVANGGQGTLNYTVSSNAAWLTVSPASGSSTGPANTITVTYNTTSLAAGAYSAAISVAATGATNTPQAINVTLTVSASPKPVITLSKTSLAPTAAQGANPANDTFAVSNGGQGTLNYTITDNATWLTVSPASGSSTGPANTITVTYNTATLTAGTYTAAITVADPNAANNPQTINVTLTIGAAPKPTITLSKASLAATPATGTNAPSDTFTVANGGLGTLNYTITDNATWLAVSPTSGSSTGAANTITVTYSTATLAAGTYTAVITVSDPNAVNNPQTINVNVTVGGGNATNGQAIFTSTCARCHSASSIAPFASRITTNMSSITSSHNGITLTTQQVADLKAYLATISGGGGGTPSITVNKTTLTPMATQGANPANDIFTVGNGGQGTLNYTITDNATWMTISPANGSSTGENGVITVQYNTASLAAGTYSAAISVAATGASNTPRTINVALTVNPSPKPTITLNKSTMVASAAQGANPPSDTFTVANSGSGTLNYTITDNANWLTVSPGSGTSTGAANTITVQYATASLAAGTYTAAISVTDANASNSPQTINVTLTISATPKPAIALNKTTLTPTVTQGANPPNDTFTVANSGSGTLTYTIAANANWLQVSPANGTSTGPANTITVQYATAALAAGTYTAAISVADANASNSPQTVNVTLTVSPVSAPTIVLNKSTLSRSVTQGSNPTNDTFTVARGGTGTLSYTITDNVSWLSVSPSSGSSTGEADTITVQYNAASLAVGTYTGTITVAAAGASNSPRTIGVTLTVTPRSTRPTIALSKTTLTASARRGSSPASNTFTVRNSGGGTLSYTISDNVGWLSVTPATGSSTGESDTITVRYSTGSLRTGTYTGTITVTSSNATNSPQTIRVTLTITSSSGGDD